MTREEINKRKMEIVNSLNSIMDEIRYDIRNASVDNDLESIIANAENTISTLERLIDELSAELDSLDVLQDEYNSLEEDGQ